MAKKVKEQKTNLPVKQEEQTMPAHLRKSGGGRGLSGRSEDNLVPLVYILQKGSPQVQSDDAAYITGAKAGTIWLRNCSAPLVGGEEGMIFLPCYFDKDVVEWIPRKRGGGFVGRHKLYEGEDVTEAMIRLGGKKVTDPDNKNRINWVTKAGNELRETRYHMGYVIGHGGKKAAPLPYCIPLTSTGHSFSRTWMFMMNSVGVDGGVADSFAKYYRLHTKHRQNAAGDWYAFEAEDAGWATEDHYKLGEKLHVAFSSGSKQAETPEMDDVTADKSEAF